MSSLVQEMLDKAVAKVERLPQPPWVDMRDRAWARVSEAMVRVLNEAKKMGSGKPLAALQDLAFQRALEPEAPTALHTVALWLTNTRIVAERYAQSKGPAERATLVARGLIVEK